MHFLVNGADLMKRRLRNFIRLKVTGHISEFPFASVSKRVCVRNHSYMKVHTKETRFETEAQGNSEMAFSLAIILKPSF